MLASLCSSMRMCILMSICSSTVHFSDLKAQRQGL